METWKVGDAIWVSDPRRLKLIRSTVKAVFELKTEVMYIIDVDGYLLEQIQPKTGEPAQFRWL